MVSPQEAEIGEHRLADAQSHYLTAVLRLKPGDIVHPFDGQGNESVAVIKSTGGKGCVIEVTGASGFAAADAALRVHVGQGMSARNRLDLAVEKMTEAGVTSITAITDFGGRKKDKAGNVSERWRRISASATAQCGRMHLPGIGEPADLAHWDATLPGSCFKIVLSPVASRRLSQQAQGLGQDADVAVLIGRASGLDEKEESFAEKLGFVPAGLGDRILRAETVGVVAMSVLLAAVGEY